MKKKQLIKKIFIYILLSILSIIMIFPFYWMVTGALKTNAEINSLPPVLIPSNIFNFDNFIEAFTRAPFLTYFLNSIIVTFLSVVITGATTILGAFAFSRFNFKGKELIFSLILSFMMVPFEMLVITNFVTVSKLGLIDTLAVLVIPFTSSIFYTYILKNFFDTIPDSLYYSAKVDGASNFQFLRKIMIPLARPSLVTIMLLNALSSWNSFMWTQLTINSDVNRTVTMGLFAFSSEGGSDQKLILAASTIVILPMLILFLFARKYIIQGVSKGGIKG